MDVQLAGERIFELEERLSFDDVRQRAMDRRTNAFGSGLGALLQRPKADDISLVASQRRLEPFWHVACQARYVYERNRDYAVPASAPEVREVTIHDTSYPVSDGARAPRTFTLTTREHCREEFGHELYADGVTGTPVADGPAVVGGPRTEISDPSTLVKEGTIVVPPQHRASFVVRQVLQEMTKPIQADKVLEEALTLDKTDLYYRPVWAFEFAWPAKDKKGIVEIDGVTGQIRQGQSLQAQLSKVITRDALFDIGADTVGLLVPGGSIAVKVARAALDKGY